MQRTQLLADIRRAIGLDPRTTREVDVVLAYLSLIPELPSSLADETDHQREALQVVRKLLMTSMFWSNQDKTALVRAACAAVRKCAATVRPQGAASSLAQAARESWSGMTRRWPWQEDGNDLRAVALGTGGASLVAEAVVRTGWTVGRGVHLARRQNKPVSKACNLLCEALQALHATHGLQRNDVAWDVAGLLLTMPDGRHRNQLRDTFRSVCWQGQWPIYQALAAKPGKINPAVVDLVTHTLCALPRGDVLTLLRDTFLAKCTPAQAAQARVALGQANRL
jgi:hypothetical protein